MAAAGARSFSIILGRPPPSGHLWSVRFRLESLGSHQAGSALMGRRTSATGGPEPPPRLARRGPNPNRPAPGPPDLLPRDHNAPSSHAGAEEVCKFDRVESPAQCGHAVVSVRLAVNTCLATLLVSALTMTSCCEHLYVSRGFIGVPRIPARSGLHRSIV